MIKVKRDKWGWQHLVWNDDVDVYIWEDDNGDPYIQIETSPDTDSWSRVRVFMNDAEASEWDG